MKTEIRSQGEIIHLLTPDGFIQIYIQSIDSLTGQVRLGVVAPSNVRICSSESNVQHLSSENGLRRCDILALLKLEEIA